MRAGPAPHLWKPAPEVDLPDTTWAYLAGLFDGEGSLQVPVQRDQHVGYRVSIAQRTDTRLCEWIAETLTYGTVSVHRQPRPNSVSYWRCNSQLAVSHFLEHTLPYLRVKREVSQEAYDHLLQTAMRWVDVS